MEMCRPRKVFVLVVILTYHLRIVKSFQMTL